uniref:Ig-like domain-containing protein n=1 Tax=Callorhinchus milii TaxID=7868 RepID=A0A4W3GS01_CALMI
AVTTPPSLYALLPYCGQSSSGGSVTVGCLASSYSPDPAIFTWTSNEHLITDQVKTYPSVLNKNGLYTLSSQLTIAESQLDNIHCKVAHKSNTWPPVEIPIDSVYTCCETPEPVKVSFLPPSPKQVLMEPIVTLTCVEANAPHDVSVTWTQEQTHLQSGYGKPSATGPQEVISKLNISTQDWTGGKVYFCIVSHDDIPTPIRKKIFKDPGEHPMYLLLPSAEELSAQQSLTLSCLVKNFAPKEIFVEWTVNDQLIDANKYKNTELMADSADYSTYSMLSISAGDWDRGYSYSCVVGHEIFPLKTLTRAVNKSSGKPSFVNISLVLMDTVNACQ